MRVWARAYLLAALAWILIGGPLLRLADRQAVAWIFLSVLGLLALCGAGLWLASFAVARAESYVNNRRRAELGLVKRRAIWSVNAVVVVVVIGGFIALVAIEVAAAFIVFSPEGAKPDDFTRPAYSIAAVALLLIIVFGVIFGLRQDKKLNAEELRIREADRRAVDGEGV